MYELEILNHKDWLASLLSYYADSVRGINNVNSYFGNSLWQKAFFAWCHEYHGLTTFTDVVKVMFGKARKCGYVLAFMEGNFTLEIARRYCKSIPVMEVE